MFAGGERHRWRWHLFFRSVPLGEEKAATVPSFPFVRSSPRLRKMAELGTRE